ncbi:MAG TPA: alpha-amylase family protein, partial [Microlunatus sp.]|nr:alpha-amylase family protein [Microlunatus sp.]
MPVPWFRKHLRVVHTILRTKDAPGYDAKAYVEHCLRLNGNALVINAGGLYAFYPTRVPGHVPVPGLDGDILGEVIEAAHSAGLPVIGRVDFRAGHPEVFAEHPDWFARDADGTPVRIRQLLYSAPATSPYRNEAFAFPVLRELLSRYDLDAIWENAPSFLTADPDDGRAVLPYPVDTVRRLGPDAASWGLVDHSPPTRERFAADTGLELPTPDAFDVEVYATYLAWRGRYLAERTATVRELIKAGGESSRGERGHISEGPTALDWSWAHHSGMELARIAPHWDIVTAPTFDLTRGSRGSSYFPVPVWRPEETAKLLRSFSGGRAPTMMFARFDNQSRYTTVAEDELRLWLAAAVANGAGGWECTFVGRETAEFLDQRCDDVVAASYALMREFAPELDAGVQQADIAVLHSQESERWFGSNSPDHDGYLQHVRGVIGSLFEAHLPFDLISTEGLTAERLGRYRTVVLANAALLSDETCAAITRFVESGGGLVATFQSSLFDERGRRRDDFGCAAVLGVTAPEDPAADLIGPLRYGCARLTDRGELTRGLDRTEVITIEGLVQRVTAAPRTTIAARLIHQVKPQPPEFGWVEDMTGSDPLIIGHRYGAGRSVY